MDSECLEGCWGCCSTEGLKAWANIKVSFAWGGAELCYPEIDFWGKTGEGAEAFYFLSLLWWAQEFCKAKNPSHTAVCQLSAVPDTTKSPGSVWGLPAASSRSARLFSAEKRKHQMLLFKQRLSFMLNTTKMTCFSVLRELKKKKKAQKGGKKKKKK